MSGSKLEPLINVRCGVMVNCGSQLKECIACQVENLRDVIVKKN